MAKFKKFLFNEEIGLGDITVKIDQIANSQWFGDQIKGALVSTDVTGSKGKSDVGHLSSTDLVLPETVKTGRIITLLLNKNPIYIRLSDGTEANFTSDEYRRIKGKPEIGKTMTLIFQRHPKDMMSGHSKINSAMIHELE
jgi:hypothetical protein